MATLAARSDSGAHCNTYTTSAWLSALLGSRRDRMLLLVQESCWLAGGQLACVQQSVHPETTMTTPHLSKDVGTA